VTRLWYARLFGRIGLRSRIAPPLVVLHPERTAIGSGVTIGPGCRVETFPPPLRSKKTAPMLVIGDRVRIGSQVRLACCTSLTIGPGVQIEDGCLITDCEYGGSPDGMAYYRQPKSGRPTVIGEGAWIGAGTAVLAGSRIGSRAIVLPGSVVSGEIPPWSMAGGSPAVVMRIYDAGRRMWLPVAAAGGEPGRHSDDNPGTNPGNMSDANPGEEHGGCSGHHPGTNPGENHDGSPVHHPGCHPVGSPGNVAGQQPGHRPVHRSVDRPEIMTGSRPSAVSNPDRETDPGRPEAAIP
jgi:hypothetical protein